MARKSTSKAKNSASSSSRKRKVHPKRTGIVWSVFVGAMTLAAGALMLGDGWRTAPFVSLARADAATGSGASGLPDDGRWQAIVIHHSGTSAGTVEEIARLHRQWGLPTLGYHFVIGNGNGEPDGDVLAGPRWIAREPGAHVAARPGGASPDAAWFNEHAIGICLIGNGERRAFTDAQMANLVRHVRQLQAAYGIPDSNVVLHSQLAEVASPGRWFPHAQFVQAIAD